MITICIPTIASRRSLLSRLLWTIEHQTAKVPVEVIIADGDWALGDKINAMFAAANGTHVAVVDDDDLISIDYLRHVTQALKDSPVELDMIGYYLLWTEQGRFMAEPLHHGLGDPNHGIEDRGACLKTLTATEIARAYPVGNEYAADHQWACQVHPEINTHVTVMAHLYHYDHWNDQMVGTDLNGEQAAWFTRPQRDVGHWPHDPQLHTWIGP